jgi:hypothetical protein
LNAACVLPRHGEDRGRCDMEAEAVAAPGEGLCFLTKESARGCEHCDDCMRVRRRLATGPSGFLAKNVVAALEERAVEGVLR